MDNLHISVTLLASITKELTHRYGICLVATAKVLYPVSGAPNKKIIYDCKIRINFQ